MDKTVPVVVVQGVGGRALTSVGAAHPRNHTTLEFWMDVMTACWGTLGVGGGGPGIKKKETAHGTVRAPPLAAVSVAVTARTLTGEVRFIW